MKRNLGCVLILGLLSIPGFAATNSKNVNFPGKLTVGTTELPAGDYKVSWTGADSNVQVTIARNGKTLATVPAKLVPANNEHVGMSTNTVNGVAVLESIQLDKFNLELTKPASAGE